MLLSFIYIFWAKPSLFQIHLAFLFLVVVLLSAYASCCWLFEKAMSCNTTFGVSDMSNVIDVNIVLFWSGLVWLGFSLFVVALGLVVVVIFFRVVVVVLGVWLLLLLLFSLL